MSVSVKDLVAQVRIQSGLKNNQFYTDADIAQFCSDGAAELYDKLVLSQQHYAKRTFDFTLTGNVGGNTVTLPKDFYKESLVELNPSKPFPTRVPWLADLVNKDISPQANVLANGSPARQAIILGNELQIFPPTNAAGDYRLTYVPLLGDLVLPDEIDLTIKPNEAPVNVTVRAVTAQATPFPVGSGFSWNLLSANSVQLVVPPTIAAPLAFDGVIPDVGDLILFLKDAAPDLNPLYMGIWLYTGVSNTAGELIYNFQRADFYTNGTVWPWQTPRVKVTDGDVFAGAILMDDSSHVNWTIGTNTADFTLAPDATIGVDLIATAPTTGGTWSSFATDTLRFVSDDVQTPDGLKFDGVAPKPGDLVWFPPDDAPLSAAHLGLWQYVGLENSGQLIYDFRRPNGLNNDLFIPGGVRLVVDGGETLRGVTFETSKQTRVNVTTDTALLAFNRLDSNGSLLLQNATFDGSYIGGTVTVQGSPLGNRSYRIVSVNSESKATLEAIDLAILAEAFGAPTEIFVTKENTIFELPQIMLPWTAYIKTYASVAVQDGRNQESGPQVLKLEALKQRVAAMASNRAEDVSQAPITKRRGGFGRGWGGW